MTKRAAFIVILWLVFCGWIGTSWLSIRGIVRAEYSILESAQAYEVRRYAPYILAQVAIQGTDEPSVKRAERMVLEYLRGNNSTLASLAGAMTPQGETIARNAPRLLYEQRASWFVASILPSSAKLTTVPRPNEPLIRLVEVPMQTVAVRTIRGALSDEALERAKLEFIEDIAADKRMILSPVRIMKYYAPSAPGFLRTTELIVTLRESGR